MSTVETLALVIADMYTQIQGLTDELARARTALASSSNDPHADLRARAIERGWFCYWDDQAGYLACEKDHPGAMPDLNRAAREAQGL